MSKYDFIYKCSLKYFDCLSKLLYDERDDAEVVEFDDGGRVEVLNADDVDEEDDDTTEFILADDIDEVR